MTKVADVREQLNAIMLAVLPSYVKLADSYETSDNANPIFQKGYTIGYSAGENVLSELCNLTQMHIRRQFQVVLTNIYMPNMDANYREGLEDSLIDDQFAFIAAVEKDVTLTGTAITSKYSSDNGIEYLIGENKQFIVIVMTLTIDYFEETA